MSNVTTSRRLASAADPTSLPLARLRGAALALTSAAAAVEQYLAHTDACAPADDPCLETRYATLLRHRELVRRASTELDRIERGVVRAAAARGQLLGWDVPYVRVSREAIDRANDLVVTALTAVRGGLGGPASADAAVV